MLGPVQARHRACCRFASMAERDEAVEDRLGALAKPSLVLIGPDAEIEFAITETGVMVYDVLCQNKPWTLTRIVGHRVGIEHHRKAMPIRDAGEHREHLVISF